MIYPPGTPTQPEIIAIALSKLDIKPTQVFVDVGCGSGSVSIAAARFAEKVYAIDNREEAIHATSENIKEKGLKNITVLMGEAERLLQDLDFDCAFVGGSKNINNVMGALLEKKKKIRFIVSAVKIDTAIIANEIMKQNNCLKEMLQIQLSRGNELGGGTMFKPENPIFLIVGGT